MYTYNNKNSSRRSKSKWYLLNRHPTTTNNKGINMKRKYQRSGKRCCGKIFTHGGNSADVKSNTDPFGEGVLLEEKYKLIDQF